MDAIFSILNVIGYFFLTLQLAFVAGAVIITVYHHIWWYFKGDVDRQANAVIFGAFSFVTVMTVAIIYQAINF